MRKLIESIRPNVLILMLAGYATLLITFVVLGQSESMTFEESYETIQAPLIALIGGSIAIAKDLVGGDGS